MPNVVATDMLTFVSLVLAIVSLLITMVGFFASLKFYRDAVSLQNKSIDALAKIEERTGFFGSQFAGMFDKTLNAAINYSDGRIEQDFDDINEQIKNSGEAIIQKATSELTTISEEEKKKLSNFIEDQLKIISDQVYIAQENTTDIVSNQEADFTAISQFQANILQLLRNKQLSLQDISNQLGFNTTVIQKATDRLIRKKIIVENNGVFVINKSKQKQDFSLIDEAYMAAEKTSTPVLLSKLGMHIKKINPNFDVRAYNCCSLSEFRSVRFES